MIGIQSAAHGRLARDAEMRETRSGGVLSFSLCANDREGRPPQWLRVSYWGEDRERLAERLTKGSEAYVRGKMTLGTWTAKDTGEERASLQLTAYEVVPMGVDAQPPQRRSRSEQRPRELARDERPQHAREQWPNARRMDADEAMNIPF